MDKLPKEVSIMIVKLVAEQADNPMDDLKSMRCSSWDMMNTVSAKEVGRSITHDRVVNRGTYWVPYYKASYRDGLTRWLADIGNPPVCLYEALRLIFIDYPENYEAPLDMLERAVEGSSSVARYVLALVLHRTPGQPDNARAKFLIQSLEADVEVEKQWWTNKACAQAVQDAHEIVHRLPPRGDQPPFFPWGRTAPHSRNKTCAIAGCGDEMGYQRWENWSYFCSEDCMIEHECRRFFW